ncbi:MAG: serine/threonine protein kinase, partial [Cyanobacteria bacterium]|nr:serine/threonine protein kinase [Cyanobacteriota bacterium]
MKESQSCPVCLKPKEKASDGFVTRFIETCQCGKGSLKEGEDLKPVRMCAQCGKRISEGRAGSLTQWIFKPDNCDCATPEPVDRYFEVSKATKPFPSVQLDKEEELDLAADEFPINRYKPTRILGQGLAGRVYLCRDRFLGTRVAIKVLQSFTATSLISFQREAKVLSTLNHPNIVRVLDFGVTEQSKPYMVMAYVEGLTLTKLIAEKGAIDEKTAMIIISKVCSALSYAHGKGVFHRDIKSDNIIATILDSSSASLEAYVADFGLAMADLPHEDSTIYQGSTVVGTPRYMSPDQAMGRSFDARSDLYSVGCIFFEMLCGHAPFAGQTAIETLKMHAEAELPPIIAPGDAAISDEVKAVVLKCLEKQPEDRYQSMEELADSLSRILELPRYAVTSARFVNNDNSGIGSTIFSATGTATGASRLLKPVVLIPLLAILVAALYFVIRFSMGKTVTPKPGSISQKWTAPAKAELPTIEELDNLVVEKRKKEPPGKQEIVHTDVIVPRKPGEL